MANTKTIVKLEKHPDTITLVYVEAVLMPNKEIIRNGKSLGYEKDLKGIYSDKK